MKIAVFWPNWVGDAVMATPAVRSIRDNYPLARLLAVVRPSVAGVLDGSPFADEVITLDRTGVSGRGWAGVAWRLRREQVDVAVLFPNSLRTALVAWFGKCKRRIGYDRYGRGLLLTDRLPPHRNALGRLRPSPVIDAYNKIPLALGCPKPSYQMEVFTTPADEAAADEVWRDGRFDAAREIICLNPGAAFGSAKHWPVEYFVALARLLADRRGSSVLVLCGPAEREMARRIADAADRPTVWSLADRPLSLGLTKACVRRSTLLVTTDSGPRHFGTAYGKPVLTLFGPTHIAWTETYHPDGVHLQKPVPCGPCQLRVCPLDHACMRLLRPDEVYNAAVELLSRRRFRPLPAA